MKSFVHFGAYAVAFAPLLGVVGFGLHELFIAKTGGSQVVSSPAVPIAAAPSGRAGVPYATPALTPSAPSSAAAPTASAPPGGPVATSPPASLAQPSFPQSSSQAAPAVPPSSGLVALPPRAALASPPSVTAAPSPLATPALPPSALTAPGSSEPVIQSPRATLAPAPSEPVASSAAASPILPFPRFSASPLPAPPAAAAESTTVPRPSFEEDARRRFEEASRLEAKSEREMSRLARDGTAEEKRKLEALLRERMAAEEASREQTAREQGQAQVAMATARPPAPPDTRRQSSALKEAALRDEKENKDELENFFPWPPPPASARITYARIFEDRKRFSNVGQAASFLEDKLAQAGFARQWSYFKLPDERAGFGVVSKMEQIDPKTAKRLPGSQGWTTDRVASASEMAWWSWGFAIQRPVGQYRVFVLIVSTRPTPDKPAKDLRENEQATFFRAQQWVSGGKGSLTSDIATLPLNANHALTIRLYEFKQQDKGASNLVPSSPLSLEQHLVGAGIDLGQQR